MPFFRNKLIGLTQHPTLAPRIYEGGARRAGGVQRQYVFAEVLVEERRCTAYSPLSCASLGHPPS